MTIIIYYFSIAPWAKTGKIFVYIFSNFIHDLSTFLVFSVCSIIHITLTLLLSEGYFSLHIRFCRNIFVAYTLYCFPGECNMSNSRVYSIFKIFNNQKFSFYSPWLLRFVARSHRRKPDVVFLPPLTRFIWQIHPV